MASPHVRLSNNLIARIVYNGLLQCDPIPANLDPSRQEEWERNSYIYLEMSQLIDFVKQNGITAAGDLQLIMDLFNQHGPMTAKGNVHTIRKWRTFNSHCSRAKSELRMMRGH